MSERLTHVILGDGVAGMSAAQVIRAKRRGDRIVVVSNDPQPFYYRAALTNYLSGALSDEELWAMPTHHWEQLRIERVYGEAVHLDVANKRVSLKDGKSLAYDRLLIGTGCSARRLQTPDVAGDRGVPGADLEGVCVMRTLSDTRRIIERIPKTKNAVVLGGGILGIEVCHGLRSRNVNATLIHRGDWLLERIVDQRGGELISRRIERDGIDVVTSSGIKEIRGSKQVKSVLLSDGTKLRCSIVVTCIGNEPNTQWLRGSGIQLNRGYIPLNRQMQVDGVQDVWAAGDVGHFVDNDLPFPNPGGLWQPARKQGQIAALGMVSSGPISEGDYRPGVLYNATKAWDLDLGSLGHHVDGEGESIVFDEHDGTKPVYKRLLLKDDHIVGAMLLGDRREGHAIRHIMNLRDAAGDVSTIKDRIFDPTFDIAAWAAARSGQPNAKRWKQTVLMPAGPLPPSLAMDAGETKQVDIANASPLNTQLGNMAVDQSLGLRIDGQLQTFSKLAIRIGALAKNDVVTKDPSIGSESVMLSLEGHVWVASTTARRDSRAQVNRKQLTKPTCIYDGDSIRLGNWTAIVELDDPGAPKRSVDLTRKVQAKLKVGDQSYPLESRVTTIGRSADNDIVIQDPFASLFHAQVHSSGDPPEFYFVDSGSEQGTFVDDERIYSAVKIEPGQMLRVGQTHMMLESVEESPTPTSSSSSDNAFGDSETYLSIESGAQKGKVFRFPIPGTIGRERGASLTLDDPLVSSNHLRIDRSGSGYTLTDQGSMNGVVISGERIDTNTPQPLVPGDSIKVGSVVLRFDDRPPSARRKDQERNRTAWLKLSEPNLSRRIDLNASIMNIGRDEGNEIIVEDDSVSRRHCRIEQTSDGFTLIDLQSSLGTVLNGTRLQPQSPTALNDQDRIEIGATTAVFAMSGKTDARRNESQTMVTSAFSIDAAAAGNPLTANLRKTVQDELDSCIGCHECMRACPLPEAPVVSIGALNSYGAGSGTAINTTMDFVEHCTQCQACVPVCPVDIHRSRIVLWNKLKATPDPRRVITVQIGDKQKKSKATVEKIANRFDNHKVLGKLPQAERIRLFAGARYRSMIDQEELVTEGSYLDFVWFVIEGRLSVGMATDRAQFQQMVLLVEGQSVGEASVLADQPSDVTAKSNGKSIVMGVSKYALNFAMSQDEAFKRAFESLYISRSVAVFLKKKESLSDLDDDVICELVQEFEPERYIPGAIVMSKDEASRTFGIIKRGFVKVIRERDGVEIVANYLKQGDTLGYVHVGPTERGEFIRYEAGTVSEVLTIGAKRLMQLDSRFPGISDRVIQSTGASVVQQGQTQVMQAAACEGILQASRLLVIDTRTCVDCDNCVTACQRRHGDSRLDRSGTGRQIGPYQVPASCFHCEDPVCLLCSVDGIVRDPSGEIRIIEDNCIGCAGCAERCPYDNIQMIPREQNTSFMARVLPRKFTDYIGITTPVSKLHGSETVAVKCDLCTGFDDGPACVRSCPTGAAKRVNPIEHFAKQS